MASAFAFSSCSKEPKPLTEAIVGKWNIYSFEADGKVEIFKPEEGCTKVPYTEFRSDKTLKTVEYKSDCSEEITVTGTYSIKGTALTIEYKKDNEK